MPSSLVALDGVQVDDHSAPTTYFKPVQCGSSAFYAPRFDCLVFAHSLDGQDHVVRVVLYVDLEGGGSNAFQGAFTVPRDGSSAYLAFGNLPPGRYSGYIVDELSNSSNQCQFSVGSVNPAPTHLACVGGVCSNVAGAGANACPYAGAACAPPPPPPGLTHLECVNGLCSAVQGAGTDACQRAGVSCVPPPPGGPPGSAGQICLAPGVCLSVFEWGILGLVAVGLGVMGVATLRRSPPPPSPPKG